MMVAREQWDRNSTLLKGQRKLKPTEICHPRIYIRCKSPLRMKVR